MNNLQAVPGNDNLYGKPVPGDGRLNSHNRPRYTDLKIAYDDLRAKLQNWKDVSENAEKLIADVDAKLEAIAGYLTVARHGERDGLLRKQGERQQDRRIQEKRLEAAQGLVKRYQKELQDFDTVLMFKLKRQDEIADAALKASR